MKNLKINFITIFLTWIIGLIIGVFLCKFFDFPYFGVDKNINLIHLLSVLSPIAVGVYINRVISKNNEKSAQINKIFNRKIEETEDLINSLSENIQSLQFDFYKIVNKITRIKRCIKLMQKHGIINEVEARDYLEVFSHVSTALTQSDKDVKISKGIITINNNFSVFIIDTLDRVQNELFEKSMDIINEKAIIS
jgi:hypothetical protein